MSLFQTNSNQSTMVTTDELFVASLLTIRFFFFLRLFLSITFRILSRFLCPTLCRSFILSSTNIGHNRTIVSFSASFHPFICTLSLSYRGFNYYLGFNYDAVITCQFRSHSFFFIFFCSKNQGWARTSYVRLNMSFNHLTAETVCKLTSFCCEDMVNSISGCFLKSACTFGLMSLSI